MSTCCPNCRRYMHTWNKALAKTMLPAASYSIVLPKTACWLTARPSGNASTLTASSTSASVVTVAWVFLRRKWPLLWWRWGVEGVAGLEEGDRNKNTHVRSLFVLRKTQSSHATLLLLLLVVLLLLLLNYCWCFCSPTWESLRALASTLPARFEKRFDVRKFARKNTRLSHVPPLCPP